MIYAVIDTNVLVSALLSHYSDAATVQVVSAISKDILCPLFNEEILAEYKEVLNRRKFRFPAEVTESIVQKVRDAGMNVNRIHSSEHFPDPKDIVFYEVALSKESRGQVA